MTAIIKDDTCLDFVLDKMRGKMILEEGITDQSEIELYRSTTHINYFTPSENGFLCVSEAEEYVFIPFAWHIGKHSTLKEMVTLGKELYRYYTLTKGKPIYYTGLKNLYGHNSVEIMENVWMFKPKNI